MLTEDDFKRVRSDVNGNPKYFVHYLSCMPDCYKNIDRSMRYAETIKLMNKIGGRKYHSKSYGDGIVFQSYCLESEIEHIERLKKEECAKWDNSSLKY